MHVLQWIAVQVEEGLDNPLEEATDSVLQYMNNELNPGYSWYDWFIVGGGRWNPVEDNQYKDATNMVISYETDKDKFEERIKICIDGRVSEFNRYRESLTKDDIDFNAMLDNYAGITDYSYKPYIIRKIAGMLQGEWDDNSYFFDAEHSSTNPQHVLDKIASGSVNWYLVPVDFHF